ncbi:MAG: hypothetical protein V1646_05340 [bacterium]
MKKFLSFGLVILVLFSHVSAMESKDVDMSEPQRPSALAAACSTFDMSQLQSAIDDIAYNRTLSHLSYFDQSQDTDFVREMYKRYGALQRDLIQLQQANPTFDFSNAFAQVNKLMTSLISNEDMLKLTYITVARKFNSEQDVTQEMVTTLINVMKCPDSTIGLEMPADASITHEDEEALKSIIYYIIKLNQEKRESFYSLLLTKPHLNEEYLAILNGQKSDLSEEFLQELITSSANITEKALRFSLGLVAQKTHERLDSEGVEYPLALMKSEIIHEISSKRAVLPLLLKHFGEIGGLSII